MQQLTSNVFMETQIRGCNHGFVTTSEGVVMIDSPQMPSDALKLKAEIAKHGELRYIINTEPHGDHWTGNAFFDAPVIAHEGCEPAFSTQIWMSMSSEWAIWGQRSQPCSRGTRLISQLSPSKTACPSTWATIRLR